MFRFAPSRVRRRPSLTPMIDVVFLLLIFFMLTAQFARDRSLPLAGAGTGGGTYSGPPRLVRFGPEGLLLNGQGIEPGALPAALRNLMSDPDDLVVLRPDAAADVQMLVSLIDRLGAAGITNLAVVD